MATSTIKPSYIKINNIPVVGDKATLGDVGVLSTSDEIKVTLGNKTLSSTSTQTKWDGITFSPGTWLCNYVAIFETSGGNGNINANVYNSSSQIITFTRHCTGTPPSVGWTVHNIFFILNTDTTVTEYPAMYQQTGKNVVCHGYFHAIKW